MTGVLAAPTALSGLPDHHPGLQTRKWGAIGSDMPVTLIGSMVLGPSRVLSFCTVLETSSACSQGVIRGGI